MKNSAILFMLIVQTVVFGQYNFQSPLHNFNTPYGNIQLGPFDVNWGHIYTNRSKFLFNKDIYVETGGLSSNNSNLSLKTSGQSRITVLNSSGFVGIGTLNPLSALHVNGDIFLPADKTLKFGVASSSSGYLKIGNSLSSFNTFADFWGNVYFRRVGSNGYSNLGASLGLQNDGTVTIGVWERYDNTVANTSGHKLMVNGGILCEKIKVITDVPNSDHVFEPTYKLKPITEVKEFIMLNKHLPEIPSANEFKTNGYNLGEMDDLLLRKVEELTLYIIQLEEKIRKLEENKSN